MSQGSGKEWIYVDLGQISDFNMIKLYWVNKPAYEAIQISNNLKDWETIKEINNVSYKDKIILKKFVSAQYVRLLLSKSNSSLQYMLSEFEIYGNCKNYFTPHPSFKVKDNKLNLNGGLWKLQKASLVKEDYSIISKPNFNDKNWIIATVPGTVLTSYLNIGAIPNPNYGDNQLQISDSFFNDDFWYRKKFNVPSSFKGNELFLNFDGINWKAIIYLNGVKIGNINGAFLHKKFDVTSKIKYDKENILVIKILKNKHPGAIKEQNIDSPKKNGGIIGFDSPTFLASIGWDWIPTIRGRNIGIWNDVILTAIPLKVTISEPYINTDLNLPDTSSATINIKVLLKNYSNKTIHGYLRGYYGDIVFNKRVEISSGISKQINFNPIKIKKPKLWWPVGYGKQHLYNVKIQFIADGIKGDLITLKSGIRKMSYKYDNDILTMYINGRRFIGRGGNWGFSESNLNYRSREYDIAVHYHADMHFNIIRNWVGQIGDKEFYEACDKYGVMVWQDFWLANPCDGPNPNDNNMFIANAKDLLLRIRNHPSIAIYVGRNEGSPLKPLNDSLKSLIKKYNSEIDYIPDSANYQVTGHGPYMALEAKDYFSLKNGNKFHSERGMANFMSYESFTRSLPEKAWWPQNNMWGIHDFTKGGAQNGDSFNALMNKGFGKPNNLKRYDELAQWINYNGYRAMFESRSKYRKGLLLWMSHSAWPSNVWQTYDYYFDVNGGYFGAKKGAEPLHVQWNPIDNTVELVNLSCGDLKNLTVEAKIVNLDGSIAWTNKTKLDSKEDSTNKCFKLDFSEKLSATHFIKLDLLDANGKVLDDNFYWRGTEENNFKALNSIDKTALLNTTIMTHKDSQWTVKTTLKNTSSIPALMIHLQVKGSKSGELILPAFFSDNYLSLLGGEEKTINIRFKQEDTRGEKPEVIVSGFNLK